MAEPHQLYDLQSQIGADQVFSQNEVEEFCKVFFKPRAAQTTTDHARLYTLLQPAVTRFSELGSSKQEQFKSLLVTFRNLYAFLSQVIPFQDSDLEKLYTYVRFLLNKLPKRPSEKLILDDDVQLKFYRLQKISEGTINLRQGDPGTVSGPTSVGTSANNEEKIELSRLIDVVNERFGTDFKPADELFFSQIREEALADSSLQQAALVNSIDNFKFVFDKALEGLFIDRMDQNQEIFARYMNDRQFQEIVAATLLRQVYKQIRERAQNPTAVQVQK